MSSSCVHLLLLASLSALAFPSPARAQETASPTHQIRSSRTEQQAADAYLLGARLLDRNELDGAEKSFLKAIALDPSNRDYATALNITREHRLTSLVQQAGSARTLGQNAKADALLAEARFLDPQNAIITQHLSSAPVSATFAPEIGGTPVPWVARGPGLAGPVTLTPSTATQSFHIHADTRTALRQVLTAFNIRSVFDDSVPSQQIRFDLENTTYTQAVPILLRMTQLFTVPLDGTSLLIAKDTLENRQRLERQVQETVYVPGSTPEQMTELGNLVRSVFDIKTANIANTSGSIILRAPAETLNALNLTLADLIDGSAQVMLDLRLYAIDKSRTRNIGPQIPQQFGIYNVASAAQNLVSSNQTLVNQAIAQGVIPANASNIQIALYLLGSGLVQSSLLTNTLGFFGNGLTLTGVTGVGTTSFRLALNSSDSRVLDNLQLRVGDRQTANFRAGTRFPITTGTYTTGSAVSSAQLGGIKINGVSASSLLNQYLGSANTATIPQVQYEDLGVTLKATPTVQKSGRVAMHLDLKIEALAGGAIDGIPILANRQFVSDITVGDGETALMISSLSKTEATAISGIPGLSELPGFGRTTSDRIAERDTSELVLLITPHVVRRRAGASMGPRIAFNQPPGSSD
ncbi:MAG: hypothetical protein NVSMB3_02550 [Acidobacteriaceae bacterium]